MGEPRVPAEVGGAEVVGAQAGRQMLWRGRAPQVGAIEVSLGLEAPVEVEVSAGGAIIRAGVEVAFADLGLDGALRLDEVKARWAGEAMVTAAGAPALLGELEVAALTGALGWALARLGWRGDEGERAGVAWLERALQGAGLKRDKRGLWTLLWRGLGGKTLLRLSVAADAVARVRLDGQGFEVRLTPGLRVVAPGLELRVSVARYRFGGEGVDVLEGPEEEGPRHAPRWWRRSLLRSLSWVASQWVGCQLPYAMRQEGYDLFEDSARMAHVAYLVSRLGALGGGKQTNQDKPTQPPSPRAPSGEGRGLVERLRPNLKAALTLPKGVTALWRGEAGPLGEVALCVHEGGALCVRRVRGALEVFAEGGGLFVAVPDLSWVSALQIERARIDLEALTLDLHTSPPLGALPTALLRRAFEEHARPWIARAIAQRWGLGGVSEDGAHLVIAHQPLGGDAVLSALLGAQDALTLRYTGDVFEVEAEQGLHVSISDLAFLPPLSIHRLRYHTQQARLTLDAAPSARGFEEAILTQMIRHRALPHAPVGLLGWRAPQPSLPLSTLRASWPLALVDVDLPVLGRLEVRIMPSDTLRVRLSDALWTVESERTVELLAPDIDLSLTVSAVRIDLRTNTLSLDGSLEVAGYGAAFLMRLLECFGWPALEKHTPLPTPGQPWRLYHAPGVMGGLDVTLDPGDVLEITRSPSRLSVTATQGLWVRPASTAILGGPVRLLAVGLDMPEGALTLQTQPVLGDLTTLVAQRLLQRVAADALNPVLARLGVSALAPSPWPEHAPLKAPVTLYAATLPAVGALRVALDATSPVTVSLDARQLRLSSQGALFIVLPDLGLCVGLKTLSVSFAGSWRVAVDTTPSLGALERRVIEGQVRASLQPLLHDILPPHPNDKAPTPEDEVLLVLGRGEAWGPVLISIAHAAPLTVSLTSQMLTMHAGQGLILRGAALDALLPSFRLSKLEYALGIGQVSLDVSEIEQRFYQEDHDVGALAEQLMEYAIKALVAPKLPPLVHQLGVVGFDEDEGDLEDEAGMRLLQVSLGAALGEVAVSLDADDVIQIGLEGEEIVLNTGEGLLISLPGLRFQCRLHHVRYHLTSGEVSVDKFGQLENALIEALLARVFPHRTVDGASFSLLGALLQARPLHPTNGMELFDFSLMGVGVVGLYMDPSARLRLSLSARELRFVCEPGLLIDGPGFANLRADGFVFPFAEGEFKLFIRRNNPLVGLLSVAARALAENRLNAMLRQYLPPAMLQPGYNLADDPHSAETIAQLIANFSVKNRKA
jgi:hypothetical protein